MSTSLEMSSDILKNKNYDKNNKLNINVNVLTTIYTDNKPKLKDKDFLLKSSYIICH